MKKVLVGVIVVVSMFFAAPAFAVQSYWGAAYSLVNADFGSGVDFDLGALSVIAGGKLNENFAIEGRLGFGVQDDDISDFTGSVEVELDTYAGIYLRGEIPVNNFRPYAVVGFSYADISLAVTVPSILVGSGSEDDSDFSYGAGADFLVNENMAVNLEYLYLMEFEDAVDVDSISFGFKYFF